MAEALRLGIFLVALAIASVAFFNLTLPWAVFVPLAVMVIGGLAAEIVFKRLATPTELQRDLESRAPQPAALIGSTLHLRNNPGVALM